MQTFVAELFDSGRVRLRSSEVPSAEDRELADQLLAQCEHDVRLELSGSVPEFDRPAASQALWQLYLLCQAFVYGTEEARGRVTSECVPSSGNASASLHYSVDLAFRFLPDLARLARASSPDHELTGVIQRLVQPWPLSSIGLAVPVGAELEPVVADECLRAVYVDRVIARDAVERSSHPIVAAEIRRIAGAHPELVGNVLESPTDGEGEELHQPV